MTTTLAKLLDQKFIRNSTMKFSVDLSISNTIRDKSSSKVDEQITNVTMISSGFSLQVLFVWPHIDLSSCLYVFALIFIIEDVCTFDPVTGIPLVIC